MTFKTLWTIIIKILGFLLIFEFLEIVSQVISSLLYIFVPESPEELLWPSLIISLAILIIYILVILAFIIKSSWIVEKLKLNQNSGEETIRVDLKSSQIITIAVIIIGGIIFINGFSLLCKVSFEYFQQKKLNNYNPNVSWIIFNSIKALIGYLMMTNSKIVVKYINKQSEIE